MHNVIRSSDQPNLTRFNYTDIITLIYILFGIGNIIWEGYKFVLLFLGLLWLLLKSKVIIHLPLLRDKAFLAFLLFLVIYFLLIPTDPDLGTATSYGVTYILYMILLVMFDSYYFQRADGKLKRIVEMAADWILLLCVFAILYYQRYPGAARLYATHRSDLSGYMIGGGYQLAYICAIMMPVKIVELIKQKKKKTLISCIIMSVLIFTTTSAIALSVAVLGCFITIFTVGTKKQKSISMILMIICLIFILLLKEPIGMWLIRIANGRVVTNISNMNNAIYVRLTEIGQMLTGEILGESSAFSLRIKNYTRPFEHIASFPLTGGILENGLSPLSGEFNDSTIITALSCWGIPMGCLFLSPIFFKMKAYKKYVGSIIVIILILLLNPSDGFSVYTAAFFLMPAIGYLSEGKNENSLPH